MKTCYYICYGIVMLATAIAGILPARKGSLRELTSKGWLVLVVKIIFAGLFVVGSVYCVWYVAFNHDYETILAFIFLVMTCCHLFCFFRRRRYSGHKAAEENDKMLKLAAVVWLIAWVALICAAVYATAIWSRQHTHPFT